MTRSETIKFLALQSIGNFLVLFAIYGVFATFGPAMVAETKYQISKVRGVKYIVAQPNDLDSTSQQLSQLSEKAKTQVLLPEQGPTFATVIAGPKEQVL